MKSLTEHFKALGEETRMCIVHMLGRREMCLGDIVSQLGLSQGAVSHHVKILKQAGLLINRRQGKQIFYSLNRRAIARLLKNLQRVVLPPAELNG